MSHSKVPVSPAFRSLGRSQTNTTPTSPQNFKALPDLGGDEALSAYAAATKPARPRNSQTATALRTRDRQCIPLCLETLSARPSLRQGALAICHILSRRPKPFAAPLCMASQQRSYDHAFQNAQPKLQLPKKLVLHPPCRRRASECLSRPVSLGGDS